MSFVSHSGTLQMCTLVCSINVIWALSFSIKEIVMIEETICGLAVLCTEFGILYSNMVWYFEMLKNVLNTQKLLNNTLALNCLFLLAKFSIGYESLLCFCVFLVIFYAEFYIIGV